MAKQSIIYQIPFDTKLKLIAIHKITSKEYEKLITYEEWVNFKKDKNFYYKVVQVI